MAVQAAQFQPGIFHSHESVMPQAPAVRRSGIGRIFGDARGGQLAGKIAGQLRPSGGNAVTVGRVLLRCGADSGAGTRSKADLQPSSITLVVVVRAADLHRSRPPNAG